MHATSGSRILEIACSKERAVQDMLCVGRPAVSNAGIKVVASVSSAFSDGLIACPGTSPSERSSARSCAVVSC